MAKGDGFFCLNFRADRAREILSALADPAFDGFARTQTPLHMLGMVDYSEAHNAFMATVYPKKQVENTLGAWVAQAGKRQFHLAETEKYPHVTFFLNGGKETPEPGEDRFMPKSPAVATYDLQPEMSAAEVTEHFIGAINAGYDLIVVNYANPDMVGHTGDLAAAAKACEAVDAGLGAALAALEMAKGDGFFCLNFRADRAREILSALADPAFDGFTRTQTPLHMLGMVDYSEAHNAFMATVYPKKQVENTLGAWVAQAGKRQFHLAETEKYPHVTFFLNGGKETPEPGEDRFMPKSPAVATYDLQPEMSAAEVTEHFIGAINAGYDLIVVNYANPDMVGHTGDLAAAAKACEAVDGGLGAALAALEAKGGAAIICADHGNCETMVEPTTGAPHTAHTLNPVPVIMVGGPTGATMQDGRLADLAPTVLALMGLQPPPEMTGRCLFG